MCLIAPRLGVERALAKAVLPEFPVSFSDFILAHKQIQMPPDCLPLCIAENIVMKYIIIRCIQFSP